MKASWLISLAYHDYFDYPLTKEELVKWQVGSKFYLKSYQLPATSSSGGYFYLKNREKLVTLRSKRKTISRQKLKIAHYAAKLLKLIPTIKFVGITGSLAMNNCHEKSDIDFMIITNQGTLWSTRLFTLLFLKIMRIPLRRRADPRERDRICINIWMDEKDLLVSNQNLYTAHELAQIVPLINRGETYERLLSQNFWIKNFWPNAAKLPSNKSPKNNFLRFKHLNLAFIWHLIFVICNLFSYHLQRFHMASSITNETVTPTRAFFHPINWSKKLETYLKKSGVSVSS